MEKKRTAKSLLITGSLSLVIFWSCNTKPESSEFITNSVEQDSIFSKLVTLTGRAIPAKYFDDTLAFLILPVQASCPSCRKKTIDQIVAHKDDLPSNHYIVISANGGPKIMNSYFKELSKELPEIPGKLFLDSANLGRMYKLYDGNPAFYYTNNHKAFKKVTSIPATIRNDLDEFFSSKPN